MKPILKINFDKVETKYFNSKKDMKEMKETLIG